MHICVFVCMWVGGYVGGGDGGDSGEGMGGGRPADRIIYTRVRHVQFSGGVTGMVLVCHNS